MGSELINFGSTGRREGLKRVGVADCCNSQSSRYLVLSHIQAAYKWIFSLIVEWNAPFHFYVYVFGKAEQHIHQISFQECFHEMFSIHWETLLSWEGMNMNQNLVLWLANCDFVKKFAWWLR